MKKSKTGFTIIEVSLAIIFVSVLILTIGYLTINITSTYEKGLAMKSVNSAGKELIDDMTRAISTSPAQTVTSLCGSKYTNSSSAYNKCVSDGGRKMIYQQYYNTVKIKGQDESVPVAGMFCTGRYTYLWNTAYALNQTDYSHVGGNYTIRYWNRSANINSNDFRILKVSDYTKKLCINNMDAGSYSYRHPGIIEDNTSIETKEDLLELTNEAEYASSDLALYNFTVYHPSIHNLTSSGFYSASFILATLRGGIDINATGEFCSDPPDNLDTDFAYCAVNKFNFSAKAEGEKLDSERW